jgi:hypothetical protein
VILCLDLPKAEGLRRRRLSEDAAAATAGLAKGRWQI